MQTTCISENIDESFFLDKNLQKQQDPVSTESLLVPNNNTSIDLPCLFNEEHKVDIELKDDNRRENIGMDSMCEAKKETIEEFPLPDMFETIENLNQDDKVTYNAPEEVTLTSPANENPMNTVNEVNETPHFATESPCKVNKEEEATTSNFNNSQAKVVKIQLNEKLKSQLKEKLSIVTEKIFEKIIPEISPTTPVKEYEISLAFNNVNELFDSDKKYRNMCSNSVSDYDILVDGLQSKPEHSATQTFRIKMANFSQSKEMGVSLVVYVKVSLAVMIFVFVFYTYLKNNAHFDNNKMLISLGLPSICFAVFALAYMIYVNSQSYKTKCLLERVKVYIKQDGNVVSKDDLGEFICHELKVDRFQFTSSNAFNKIQDQLSLDQNIEEFIDHNNMQILSWRKKTIN